MKISLALSTVEPIRRTTRRIDFENFMEGKLLCKLETNLVVCLGVPLVNFLDCVNFIQMHANTTHILSTWSHGNQLMGYSWFGNWLSCLFTHLLLLAFGASALSSSAWTNWSNGLAKQKSVCSHGWTNPSCTIFYQGICCRKNKRLARIFCVTKLAKEKSNFVL